MFSRLPVKKLSRQSTSFPSLSSRSQRCEPMNPAPPVIKIRIISPSNPCNLWLVFSRPSHRKIPEIKHVHLRLSETINRFLRRADDRLILIERRIQNHRHTRQRLEIRDQLIITRIHLARDSLQATGAIEVRHGRDLAPPLVFDLIDHQHRRRRVCLFKIISDALFYNGWRKRSKRLALLDPVVQNLLHLHPPWIDHDRSIPERAWSKLHPSLKPSNDQTVSNILRRTSC